MNLDVKSIKLVVASFAILATPLSIYADYSTFGHGGSHGGRGGAGEAASTLVNLVANSSQSATSNYSSSTQNPSASSTSSYASSYSSDTQNANSNSYPIIFIQDQLTALGITHPVNNDFSEFQVQNTGVYQIAWTFTILQAEAGAVTVNLVNASTNTPFQPSPFSTQSIPLSQTGTNVTVSGQTLLSLQANTGLRLEVSTTAGGLQILNPSFTITQIGSSTTNAVKNDSLMVDIVKDVLNNAQN